MRPVDDPTPLTADERREEVASILAAGGLRLHARAALSLAGAPEKSPELTSQRLEVSETLHQELHMALNIAKEVTASGG